VVANPDSELIPVARANGITHALLAPEGGVVAGQSGLVALDGWTTEQMAVKCPAALHVYWPSLDLDLGPREPARGPRAKPLEEQAKDRRARLKALDDFFDDARAYAKARDAAGKDGAAALEVNPAWEAMRPYLRGELPLMIHADELRQIKSALRWAETNGFKVILAGGRDAWMAADQLAAKKVPLIYEHVFTLPARDTDPYDVHFRAPALLRKAGVTVAFGGRRQAASLRNLPYEAAQAAAFGLPAEEALKGLTLYPAQILGVAGRLGSIEPGKEATIFAADGHILDIRANVKRMWIAGREVSLETRHTRLYDRYKQRPLPK
jgi:imidazolonepropionase-like amidohydrolase